MRLRKNINVLWRSKRVTRRTLQLMKKKWRKVRLQWDPKEKRDQIKREIINNKRTKVTQITIMTPTINVKDNNFNKKASCHNMECPTQTWIQLPSKVYTNKSHQTKSFIIQISSTLKAHHPKISTTTSSNHSILRTYSTIQLPSNSNSCNFSNNHHNKWVR